MSEYQEQHEANRQLLVANWVAPLGVALLTAVIVGVITGNQAASDANRKANERDIQDHLMIEKIQTSIGEIKETVKSNHQILTDLQKNDVLQDHRIKVLEEKVP